MAQSDTSLYLQALFYLLKGSSLLSVPSDFNDQVAAVKKMLQNDKSGIVSSLFSFAIDSSNTSYAIKTENAELNAKYNNWFSNINRGFNHLVPSGVNALVEQYLMERWTSSLVIMAIHWKKEDGWEVPDKVWFLDGSGVSIDGDETMLSDFTYKIGNNVLPFGSIGSIIVSKPFDHWYTKYPTPFLIRRGIYYNYKLKELIKDKGKEIIAEALPYMLMVKMGSEGLERANVKVKKEDIAEAKTKLEETVTTVKEAMRAGVTTTPAWYTSYDKSIDHIIPDLKNSLHRDLFYEPDRDILSGWGLVEIIRSVGGSSRLESVMNPKPFISECHKAVNDFKLMLTQLLMMIEDRNRKEHKKSFGETTYPKVNSRPLKTFFTDTFLTLVRSWFDRGIIGYETALDLGLDLSYETEKERRKKEANAGDKITFYPNLTQNLENVPDIEEIPDDKTNPVERKNYKNAMCLNCGNEFDVEGSVDEKNTKIKCPDCDGEVDLELAPYTKTDYPLQLKSLPVGARMIWIITFNTVYAETKDENQSRRAAWHQVKLKYKKNIKTNKWERKK